MGILISDEIWSEYGRTLYISILTGSQEIRDIPFEEDFESVDEDKHDIPESAPVCDVRLEAIVIGVLFEVKSLDKHSPA